MRPEGDDGGGGARTVRAGRESAVACGCFKVIRQTDCAGRRLHGESETTTNPTGSSVHLCKINKKKSAGETNAWKSSVYTAAAMQRDEGSLVDRKAEFHLGLRLVVVGERGGVTSWMVRVVGSLDGAGHR